MTYHNTEFTKDPMTAEEIISRGGVFVFGSNEQGMHGGGAALFAKTNLGAVDGIGRGFTSNYSYGIATLDYATGSPVKVSLAEISKQIDRLFEDAVGNPVRTFFVTKIGAGIAGFSIFEIASCFYGRVIPRNVIMPEEFVNPEKYGIPTRKRDSDRD